MTKKCTVFRTKFGLCVKNEGIFYPLHKSIEHNYKEGDEAEFDLKTSEYQGREQRTAFAHDKNFKAKGIVKNPQSYGNTIQLDNIEKMLTEVLSILKKGE